MPANKRLSLIYENPIEIPDNELSSKAVSRLENRNLPTADNEDLEDITSQLLDEKDITSELLTEDQSQEDKRPTKKPPMKKETPKEFTRR